MFVQAAVMATTGGKEAGLRAGVRPVATREIVGLNRQQRPAKARATPPAQL